MPVIPAGPFPFPVRSCRACRVRGVRRHQAGRGAAGQQVDAGQPYRPHPDGALQHRPAGEQRGQSGGGRVHPQPGEVPARLAQHLGSGCARRRELPVSPGYSSSMIWRPRSISVQMPALRGAPAPAGAGAVVALDEHDAVEGVREHPGGQQPGDARAECSPPHGVPTCSRPLSRPQFSGGGGNKSRRMRGGEAMRSGYLPIASLAGARKSLLSAWIQGEFAWRHECVAHRSAHRSREA